MSAFSLNRNRDFVKKMGCLTKLSMENFPELNELECEVFILYSLNITTIMIAKELNLSESAVRSRLKSCKDKMGCDEQSELKSIFLRRTLFFTYSVLKDKC